MSCLQCVFHRLNSVAYRHLQINLAKLLHKEVAILCVHDSLDACSKHLYAILLQCAVKIELGSAVQCSLSAECQQNAIGALFLDDFGNEVCINGLEIHLVCNTLASLDGSNVRVYEYTLDAFFAKCFQGLRARVVELASLSDFQSTRAEY